MDHSKYVRDIALVIDGDPNEIRTAPLFGSTLHAGRDNAAPPCGIRRNLPSSRKPCELQWRVCSPQVGRHFQAELTSLADGARSCSKFGNLEAQPLPIILGDHVPDHPPAIDALRRRRTRIAAMFAWLQIDKLG